MKQNIILLIKIFILPYIMNYNVHFYVFCDDFCVSVKTGGVTTEFPKVSDKSQPRDLYLNIDITNEVSILIENDGGQFGFGAEIEAPAVIFVLLFAKIVLIYNHLFFKKERP